MPLITQDTDLAVSVLQQGRPVAIPTETVYGLAAGIHHKAAIEAVFAMKNRPLSHPLIVHVHEDWDLDFVSAIPDYAKQLMAAFWPGPLTLVLPTKAKHIDPLITGGQTTVALRCPAHPLAQTILQGLQQPLVAPSANQFGKTSPTTALHVAESFPDSDLMIVDGGRCQVGIESTIVDATHPEHYQILRPGVLDEAAIAKVIPTVCIQQKTKLRVSGQLDYHYQPNKPLYYFDSLTALQDFCAHQAREVYLIATETVAGILPDNFCRLGQTPSQVAYDLYYQLHVGDASLSRCIVIQLPPDEPAWEGIRERIIKAGVRYNRTPTA